MIVKCSLMMVKCSSLMVKWVYVHTLISPSLTRILLAFAWSKPSFSHLTIIEKLHKMNLWNHFLFLCRHWCYSWPVQVKSSRHLLMCVWFKPVIVHIVILDSWRTNVCSLCSCTKNICFHMFREHFALQMAAFSSELPIKNTPLWRAGGRHLY